MDTDQERLFHLCPSVSIRGKIFAKRRDPDKLQGINKRPFALQSVRTTHLDKILRPPFCVKNPKSGE